MYVMNVKPALMPVAIPVALLMVATAGLAVDHVPPAGELL